jgi:hypothetical protein
VLFSAEVGWFKNAEPCLYSQVAEFADVVSLSRFYWYVADDASGSQLPPMQSKALLELLLTGRVNLFTLVYCDAYLPGEWVQIADVSVLTQFMQRCPYRFRDILKILKAPVAAAEVAGLPQSTEQREPPLQPDPYQPVSSIVEENSFPERSQKSPTEAEENLELAAATAITEDLISDSSGLEDSGYFDSRITNNPSEEFFVDEGALNGIEVENSIDNQRSPEDDVSTLTQFAVDQRQENTDQLAAESEVASEVQSTSDQHQQYIDHVGLEVAGSHSGCASPSAEIHADESSENADPAETVHEDIESRLQLVGVSGSQTADVFVKAADFENVEELSGTLGKSDIHSVDMILQSSMEELPATEVPTSVAVTCEGSEPTGGTADNGSDGINTAVSPVFVPVVETVTIDEPALEEVPAKEENPVNYHETLPVSVEEAESGLCSEKDAIGEAPVSAGPPQSIDRADPYEDVSVSEVVSVASEHLPTSGERAIGNPTPFLTSNENNLGEDASGVLDVDVDQEQAVDHHGADVNTSQYEELVSSSVESSTEVSEPTAGADNSVNVIAPCAVESGVPVDECSADADVSAVESGRRSKDVSNKEVLLDASNDDIAQQPERQPVDSGEVAAIEIMSTGNGEEHVVNVELNEPTQSNNPGAQDDQEADGAALDELISTSADPSDNKIPEESLVIDEKPVDQIVDSNEYMPKDIPTEKDDLLEDGPKLDTADAAVEEDPKMSQIDVVDCVTSVQLPATATPSKLAARLAASGHGAGAGGSAGAHNKTSKSAAASGGPSSPRANVNVASSASSAIAAAAAKANAKKKADKKTNRW